MILSMPLDQTVETAVDPAGKLLSVKKLGTVRSPDTSLRSADVYYLTYYSSASGGSQIAAKLFVPAGQAPIEGWPVTLWCHGLGDPAMDFRRWPFVDKGADSWQDTRGYLTGRWAHSGYATLVPWLPGAGPSEPLMSYSPLSLARNAQAVADGLLALRQFPQMLSGVDGERVSLNYQQQVLRSDCVSSPLLVYLAAHLQDFEGTRTVRSLVADDFQPSVAYNISYLNPYLLKLSGRMAAAMRCIWSRTTWALAKEQGWPVSEFFTPDAIALFGQQVETPVGVRDRIFASRLVPPLRSELAPLLASAVAS
ncbi:MAG: hypothetical protein WBC73_03780, partial [Phormidesmis sp.]